MELLSVIKDLIRFKSITGNTEEINKCIDYILPLFEKTGAVVEVFKGVEKAPVLMIKNTNEENLDVLVLGHLDVVPASDDMFEPTIKDGKMYGRGSLDMKSFAAVGLKSMEYVLKNNLNIKFGIILSSDEEKGSHGTHSFLEAHSDLNAKIVLDNDVGGSVYRIINACKNPVFIKIMVKGLEAHGSTPWDGIDANEKLMLVWGKIREIYPYFSKDTTGKPKHTWIDTVHFAKISGGDVANVISNYAEALLGFRLTDTSTLDDLKKNLDKCMLAGVSYDIVSSSNTVVMDKNNHYIQDYKTLAEEILESEIKFEQIGGATDSRAFYLRGADIIMHSGTGEGMHADGEYVEIDSVEKISDIQINFLKKLANA